MGDGGKYASVFSATPGKIVASVLVVIWLVGAFFLGGPGLAARAVVFFMFPLAIVWIPDVITEMGNLRSPRRLDGAPIPWV